MSEISPKVTNLISYKKTIDDKLKSICELGLKKVLNVVLNQQMVVVLGNQL